ncbi:Isochorismatase family protein [Tepidimonas alkaliphilus]|uniref:Isochorismatase family protein n=1 Tax=Tepidimonas alkaliphilus TaxID=2588942 RepID=A0A554W3M7_9BURK|nr:isochorismatase family protein [Tepidimonas alkaliphilus]TSE18181.1 Isochorismatase family protein [Tepidimonas alkaliphilus]
MLLDANDCQLVLIDYQPRLMAVIDQREEVLQQAGRLVKLARLLEVPIWGTEQAPDKLGMLPPDWRGACQHVWSKVAFDSSDTPLRQRLCPARMPPAGNARSLPKHLRKPAEPARSTVLLAGCEAHVCVLQTAFMLLEHEELEVVVVTDACGSRRQRDRDAAFDRMAAEGVTLVTTEMVGFEWLRSAQHPRFTEALAVLK